jgi:undecaprenyl-phosphate 4-deoxy-4-formamido-L-arabinose transferase
MSTAFPTMPCEVIVVVAVYNAAPILPLLVQRIAQTLAPRGQGFEIILVDDGSADDSWAVIRALSQQYPWLAGLRLARNCGQYPAIMVGLAHARGAVAVTLDDDLQHPPEAIPLLLDALDTQTDIVYGAPQNFYKPPLYRVQAVVVRLGLAAAGGAWFLRHMRAFRAVRTALYAGRMDAVYPGSALEGVLAQLRPRIRMRVVRVAYGVRAAGKSTYTWQRSARLAFNLWKSVRHASRHPRGQAIYPAEATAWLQDRIPSPPAAAQPPAPSR